MSVPVCWERLSAIYTTNSPASNLNFVIYYICKFAELAKMCFHMKLVICTFCMSMIIGCFHWSVSVSVFTVHLKSTEVIFTQAIVDFDVTYICHGRSFPEAIFWNEHFETFGSI